jgi:hypothetical protein
MGVDEILAKHLHLKILKYKLFGSVLYPLTLARSQKLQLFSSVQGSLAGSCTVSRPLQWLVGRLR